jgi:RNA polymerase sigma-70 factor (ECF subfamily)
MPEGAVDDAELAARLRAGDETAFAGVIHAYGRALHRVARCYVPTEAAADEAVQETWLAVIDGIERFEARSSVKTWIFGILKNVARRHGRRERRSIAYGSATDPRDTRGEHCEPGRLLPTGHAHGPPPWRSFSQAWECRPDDVFARRETMGAIAAAIAALCPSQREVITLRDVEGRSAAEVCEALLLSPVHQRVLLHRARMRVRAALEPDVVGDL